MDNILLSLVKFSLWRNKAGYGPCVSGSVRLGVYLEQAEHGVAHVEAVPPVVVGDGTVTLPHCVHPPRQRLREKRQRDVICPEGVLVSRDPGVMSPCYKVRSGPRVQGNALCPLGYRRLGFTSRGSLRITTTALRETDPRQFVCHREKDSQMIPNNSLRLIGGGGGLVQAQFLILNFSYICLLAWKKQRHQRKILFSEKCWNNNRHKGVVHSPCDINESENLIIETAESNWKMST